MGALSAWVNGAWQPVGVVGATGPAGADGDLGPTGATGPQGTNVVIIGNFGDSKTPSDLPPDGNLPADWDDVGAPSRQMILGEALLYNPLDELDPLWGHLYEFVGQTLVVEGWIDAGAIHGPQGVDGVPGETGATGATGPAEDEVWVGPAPTGASGPSDPNVEIWFDPTTDRFFGGSEFPLGGSTGNALIKASTDDGDLEWSGGSGDSIRVGDNAGFLMSGGGGIFKKSGAGWVLRRHNNNASIPIENNDGTAGTNIFTANGAVPLTSNAIISWPNEAAPTTKMTLYGTATSGFGFGIEGGTLTAFTSTNFRIRTSSMTGAQIANISAAGSTLPPLVGTTYTISWISGWSGTCEFRVNAGIVTCTMEGVGFNADTAEPARVKMFAYPSGVPAPWRRLWTTIFLDQGTAAGWYDNANVEFNTDGVWLNCYDNRKFYNDQQFRASMSWPR